MPKPDPSNPASKGPLIDNPINDSQEDFLEVDGFTHRPSEGLSCLRHPSHHRHPGRLGHWKDQPPESLVQILVPRQGRQHSTPSHLRQHLAACTIQTRGMVGHFDPQRDCRQASRDLSGTNKHKSRCRKKCCIETRAVCDGCGRPSHRRACRFGSEVGPRRHQRRFRSRNSQK